MAKSPTVLIPVQDNSSYTVTTSDTILAIVGYATKGKIGEPVLCSSKGELIQKFGSAPKSSPYGMLAAYRAFNQTNQIIYLRVADEISGDSDEAIAAERIITGAAGNDRIRIVAKEKGSELNGMSILVETVVSPITGDSSYNIYVVYKGETVEKFTDVSWKLADENFFKNVINKPEDNGGSGYITVDVYNADGDSMVKIPDGAYLIGKEDGTATDEFSSGDTWTAPTGDSKFYDYRAGTDGVPSNSGVADTLFVNAITNSSLKNTELWDFHILITPDTYSETVQGAVESLLSIRKEDFIYIADPPQGLTYSEVVDWHNGKGSGRNSALNNAYVSTYWSWQKEYNPDAGEYIWVGPSSFVTEAYLYTDRVYKPWYAPAGDRRGKIHSYEVEYSPSFSEREVLYGDPNAVNPIVNFNAKGIEIYGQKTTLRETSALNRVNVVRLLIYIKKLAKKALDNLIFEPHNPDTWTRATNMLNAILEPIRQDNGLDDYKVVIDATFNTPDVIAQGIMKGMMEIVPTGTVEIIQIPIKVDQAGSTIG